MNTNPRIAVFGATGLVGRATVGALTGRGAVVVPLSAPRLPPVEAAGVRQALANSEVIIGDLLRLIDGLDAVVIAAGNPDASGTNEPMLMAPNALLPAIIAVAAREAGVGRLVHVSSAAVQGNVPVLDDSADVSPFSAYSRSKALGEELVLEVAPGRAVVYRPPGVHASARRVTQLTAKLARSRFASVASPGASPSAQALLENVSDAVAFLAMCSVSPPGIVIHPSEGLTTASVLELLGGRRPVVIPRLVARSLVAALVVGGKLTPALAAQARRIEVLWFGQRQARSWLTDAGWSPPAGHDSWRRLGEELAGGLPGRAGSKRKNGEGGRGRASRLASNREDR